MSFGGLFRNVVAPLASAGGDVALGMRQDKLDAIKAQMEQIASERQAKNDAISNALKMREMGKLQLGDPGYAGAMGAVRGAETSAETPALVSRATAMVPVEGQKAATVASATAPIEVKKATDIATAEVAPHVQQAVQIATESPDKPVVSVQAPLQPGDPAMGVQLTPGANGVPTAKSVAIPGIAKQAPGTSLGARGFGQGGIFGGASGLGSIKEMHAAIPNLEKFEIGLLSEAPGSPSLKAFDTFRQNILNAGMHAGGGHGAIGTAVNAALRTGAADELARINPQLAEYGRNVAQWIVGDLNLTRSATDERGRWDQLASSVLGLPVSDMPFANRRDYITQIREARRARLSGLDQVVPAAESMLENISHQGGHSTVAPASHTSSDPEFDALIAKHRKPAP